MLADADPTEPIMDTLRRAIVAFNDYGETELPALRRRMTLITTVPALQGYSMLRYAEWCTVIAEFVAQRLGVDPADQIPQVIANAALGTSMATYRHWIQSGDHDLLESLDLALRLLAVGFSDDALR
jgi:hypothetical protein